jgi:hypothetical protein
MDPIYAFLGNGTIYQDQASQQYIIPCDMLSGGEDIISLTLGGTQFGMKFGDFS